MPDEPGKPGLSGRLIKIGRGASRTACPRGAWAREVFSLTPLVPHALRGNALGDAPRHKSALRHLIPVFTPQ
ncbi:DUF1534 domain-containing protein, partial [Pseudomonas syringae]|nr:DUF1534 domain-containing protein [Pseudomonas syringae]